MSDGQAVPTTHSLYVPVHRPATWAGLETLITLIEMSDRLRARHDFNLLEAGLLIRPDVSRDDDSAHGRMAWTEETPLAFGGGGCIRDRPIYRGTG